MMARRSRISETDPLGNTWTRAYDAMSRVTRITNHALSLAATDLEYEVTRVKSPVLGRDLNPLGRGDGTYYCNGGNATLSSSVAVRSAKPRLTGESAIGFGSSVNNQCCGAGAGSAGGASPPGEFPRIPIHPINNDPATHRRLKKPWPSGLFERLEYWAEIENDCVGNSTGVTYSTEIVHMYCQDKCLKESALRLAAKLLSLCKHPISGKYECAVYVADLPENRWQSIHEWDHWGTVLLWDCQQDYKSPLVKCLCGKKDGGISAAEVNDCIKQLFGGEVVRCSWTGGGGGEIPPDGEEPPDEPEGPTITCDELSNLWFANSHHRVAGPCLWEAFQLFCVLDPNNPTPVSLKELYDFLMSCFMRHLTRELAEELIKTILKGLI